jgi:hypothetical protein
METCLKDYELCKDWLDGCSCIGKRLGGDEAVTSIPQIIGFRCEEE